VARDTVQHGFHVRNRRLFAPEGIQNKSRSVVAVFDFHVQLLQRSNVWQLHNVRAVVGVCGLPDR
jgi:hypothetical protein